MDISTPIIQEKGNDSCTNLPTYDDHRAVITELVKPDHIRTMLRWLHAPGDTFEIRTLHSQKDKWAKTSCGYFRDVEIATEAVVEHVSEYEPAQVYVTLNPTIPSLYARVRDHIEPRQSVTTKDENIARRRNILIDCDPHRPAQIPSSDSELAAAKDKSEVIRAFLSERGLPAPLVGMSGNGYHLIYGVDWEITTDGEDLVDRFVKALSKRFDDAVIKIDTSVTNLSRISKVYGTFPRKGDGADDRHNRMAFIVDAPERVHVDRKLIEEAVAEITPQVNPTSVMVKTKTSVPTAHAGSKDSSDMVNIVKFLDRRNIGYRDAGDKYILDQCAFDPNHNNGEVAVFQNSDGSLGYHCFHNSCSDKRWKQFVNIVGHVTADDYDSTTLPSVDMQCILAEPTIEEDKGLAFHGYDDLFDDEHEAEGYWGNYIQPGILTLLAGDDKAGKSTLMQTLYTKWLLDPGEELLAPTTPCKAVVITEESTTDWKGYWAINDWPPDLDLQIMHAWEFLSNLQVETHQKEYIDVLHRLGRYMKEHEKQVVVFDTLTKVFNIESQDSVSSMKAILDPMKQYLCHHYRLSVVLLHHTNKGKEHASPTHAVRGSGHTTADA